MYQKVQPLCSINNEQKTEIYATKQIKINKKGNKLTWSAM